MTRTVMKPCMYLCIVSLLVTMCSGCLSRHSYDKRQFILEATRPTQQSSQSHDVVLMVRTFMIDPVCDSLGFMYRKGESEYESDFYNEFLIAPQTLISSQTRKWLSKSGAFKTVLEPGSLIEPTHVLEGNILAIHGDFRSKNSPEAVLEIRFFLVAIERSGQEVAFTQDYRVSQPLEAQTADALTAAFERCLVQILTSLERDLSESL